MVRIILDIPVQKCCLWSRNKKTNYKKIYLKRYLHRRSLYYPVHFGIIASCLMNSNLFRIDSLDLSFVQALCATYGQVFEQTIAIYCPESARYLRTGILSSRKIRISGPCIPGRNCLKTIKVSKLSIPVLFIYLV